jgi:hypothetical protein
VETIAENVQTTQANALAASQNSIRIVILLNAVLRGILNIVDFARIFHAKN